MLRLAEGVYSWGSFNAEKKYNFNGFLFTGPAGTIVVDPPALSPDDTAYLDELGLSPELVVVTNRNHLRARASFAAPLAMHEAEIGQVGVPVDRKLKEGDVLPPGLRVVHLPGKSPGEIGLYWPERGILMLGDALIAPRGQLALIPAAKLDDPARLKASLAKLAPLDFDVLLLADGEPLLGKASDQVKAFLRSLA